MDKAPPPKRCNDETSVSPLSEVKNERSTNTYAKHIISDTEQPEAGKREASREAGDAITRDESAPGS